MSFPRYPKYKDSGVEWLGEVPEHWEVTRLKHACNVFPSNVDKKSYDDEKLVSLCNYTDVYYNETITAGMEFMAATATPAQISKFTLRAGDTIITKDSETADDIAIAAHVPEDLPGVICGYHLSMVRPKKETNGAFVKRLFDSVYAKSCFAVLANGLTRVGLGQHELDNIELPFPPTAEQTQIAAFLDRETEKIDELVAEQQRLIELLKEKRQAVISHAVTKGLNPHAPMKPSGIEWLGDVPKHWEIGKLKRLVSTRKGIAFKADDFTDEGVMVVKASDIKGLTIRQPETFLPRDFVERYSQAILKAGEIVLSTVGSIAEVRNSAVGQLGQVPNELAGSLLNQNTVIFTPSSDQLRNGFLFLALQAIGYRDHLDLHAHGTANQASLNVSDMLDFTVPLPDQVEQDSIASHVFEEIERMNDLTAEAQRAVDLLQERRTALISAAVTGQIDVRQLANKKEAA